MFYQTWYFYTACLLALSAMTWGAWRFRIQLDRQKCAVVLSERARLSREIHDTLLQSLVGVTLQLEDMANDVPGLPSGAQVRLVAMRRRIAAYIREARRSIRDLRSPMLETHDLPDALRELVSRAIAGAPVRFTVNTTGRPGAVPRESRTRCSGSRRKPSPTPCVMREPHASTSSFGSRPEA